MSRGTHYVPFHKYRLWWNFGRKEEEEEEVITRRGPSTERRWPFPLRKNNVLASNFVLIWVIQIHGVVQYYDVHRNSRATSMCSDNVQGKSLSGAHIIHAWSMYTRSGTNTPTLQFPRNRLHSILCSIQMWLNTGFPTCEHTHWLKYRLCIQRRSDRENPSGETSILDFTNQVQEITT